MRTKAAARQNEALCARYGATATRRDTPLNPRSLTVDGIGRDFEGALLDVERPATFTAYPSGEVVRCGRIVVDGLVLVLHPMARSLLLALALAAGTAPAGYACRDLADPEGRRWFQDAPCPPGQVHDPIPPPPLIREAPRLPEGAGRDAGGSSWQVLGFDERGRTVGYWVRQGTAVPFVSTEVVRVTPGGRRGRGYWRTR